MRFQRFSTFIWIAFIVGAAALSCSLRRISSLSSSKAYSSPRIYLGMVAEEPTSKYQNNLWNRFRRRETQSEVKSLPPSNATVLSSVPATQRPFLQSPGENSDAMNSSEHSIAPIIADVKENDNIAGFVMRSVTSILGRTNTATEVTNNFEATIYPEVIEAPFDPLDPASASYIPTGILGNAKRILRRRLLNLLDRSDERWSKAVGPYSDPIVTTVATVNISQVLAAEVPLVRDEQNITQRGLFRRATGLIVNFIWRKPSLNNSPEDSNYKSHEQRQLALASSDYQDYRVFSSKRDPRLAQQKATTPEELPAEKDPWTVGKVAYQLLTIAKTLRYIDLTGQYPSEPAVTDADLLNPTVFDNDSSLREDDAVQLADEVSEYANASDVQRTGILLRNLLTASKEVIVDSARTTLSLTGNVARLLRTTNASRDSRTESTHTTAEMNINSEPPATFIGVKGVATENNTQSIAAGAGQAESAPLSVSQRMWNAIPYLRGVDSQIPNILSSDELQVSGGDVEANGKKFAGKDGQMRTNITSTVNLPVAAGVKKGAVRRGGEASATAAKPVANSSLIQAVSAEYASLLPSKADFAYIATRRTELAVTAALTVNSEATAQEYMKYIGLKPLLAAFAEKGASGGAATAAEKADAVKSLNTLVRYDKTIAAQLASKAEVINLLCDHMEAPMKGFLSLQYLADRERNLNAQREATALVERMVRSSDAAVSLLRNNERLRKALASIAQFDIAPPAGTYAPSAASTWASEAVTELHLIREGKVDPKAQSVKTYKVRKQSNETAVAEYDNLQTRQMARVAAWGLGGVTWRPRVPGQKGLRILSLDGGGTRGVLSIAYLKEIMKRVNRNLEPFQMFDIICGTSTGGIIAALLGAQRASLAEAEVLYDAFIDKIFAQRSNLRLVTEQAAYDGRDWEKILFDMCGDQLLLDSNQHDCARFFCVSTKVNMNPPLPNLWRNYNYPPGQSSRYPGACRVNTFTAIRATTAAPTFFTPVQWESGLYCDGALVANNPTAIALQEAKVLYPNVPVELVVSIGTGYSTTQSSMQSMGWDVLVNQLIASSTDTEDVHALLKDFLSPDKYFRFNPLLTDILRIDEKNKTLLTGLKNLARKSIEDIEYGPGAKDFSQLIKTLRGSK